MVKPRSWPTARRLGLIATAPVVVAISVLAGLKTETLGLVLVALVMVGLAVSMRGPLLRAAIVLFGSIFVFQSESIALAFKGIFVSLAILMALQSLRYLLTNANRAEANLRVAIRGILVSASLLVVFVGWQALSILWTRVSLEIWLRDSLNYLLLPISLVIGAEAGLRLSARITSALTLSVGFLGAAAVLAAWLERRGGADIGFAQFGLASSFTVFVSVALCLAKYFGGGRGHPGWLVAALLQLGMMVATGGRQPAVFACLALVAAVLCGSGQLMSRLGRTVVAVTLTVGAYFAVILFSTSFGGGIAVGRFQFFTRLFEEGSSVVANDASALDRANAYSWLLHIWQENPLFGQGLGHYLPSVRTGEITVGVLTLDSPVVVLSKFGIFGALVLAASLVMIFVAVHRLRRHEGVGDSVVGLFWIICALVVAATLPNGFPVENRGFSSFALMFVMVGISQFVGESRGSHGAGGSGPHVRPYGSVGADFASPR